MIAQTSSQVIIVVLAILVLFVVGIFFLVNFGLAGSDVSSTSVNSTQAQCQSLCQDLIAVGFNYDSCDDLLSNSVAVNYADNCVSINGPCMVTIKASINCFVQ